MQIQFINIAELNIQDAKQNAVEYLKEAANNSDIICFQEASPAALKQICKILTPEKFNLNKCQKHSSDDCVYFQATFVNKKHKILESSALLEKEDLIGMGLFSQVLTSGGILNIMNFHGTYKPENKLDSEGRIFQSESIVNFLKSKSGGKIIGGDFNLEPNTNSIKIFSEHDYQNLINEYKIPTTRNRFVWDRFPENKMYFADYVFVSSGIRISSFEVPNIEISDHLPLVLEFELQI